jgi:predicted metal-binding membrane protein
VPDPTTVAAIPRRDRVLIFSCLTAITALAWAYLIRLDRQMSEAMEYDTAMAAMGMSMDASWTTSDVWFAFLMWLVMMVGMMTAAAAPVLLLFAATAAGRQQRGIPVSTLTFGLGYFVLWAGFSASAALAQWGLHQAAMLSPAMSMSSPVLGGAILVAAGVYQLMPVKGACLAHCRSPLGFLMSHWRDGVIGSFEMGVRHGAYCLGCCWALMCVLFVVGVMNLVWVAALSGFVLLEKIGPAGTIVARVAGAAMVLVGVFVIGAEGLNAGMAR